MPSMYNNQSDLIAVDQQHDSVGQLCKQVNSVGQLVPMNSTYNPAPTANITPQFKSNNPIEGLYEQLLSFFKLLISYAKK